MTIRCPWAEKPEEMTLYHDREWGVPVHDDTRHFEFLVLESAQAGLSWLTILRKREGYRRLFAGFDPVQVAAFDEKRMEALRQDPAIIRNKAKIKAAVNNARAFLTIQEEYGSFDNYVWGFVDGTTIHNEWESMETIPATSKDSENLAKDLKKRGFSFLGPTTVYAHMQATGMVNDHLVSCFRYRELREGT